MILFGKKRRERAERLARLEADEAFIDAKIAEVQAQAPRVNALVAWVEARKLINGFGDDFEFTLANPRR